jgi:histidine triad (HIT) family protein
VRRCPFCAIVARKAPARIVHEDDDTLAFEDIRPQASTHVLVIPKKHIASMSELAPEDEALMGKVFRAGAAIARQRGLDAAGWRAAVNAGRDAGQTVFHIHLHVIGGRAFGWPPG